MTRVDHASALPQRERSAFRLHAPGVDLYEPQGTACSSRHRSSSRENDLKITEFGEETRAKCGPHRTYIVHISDLMPTCLSLSRRMLAYYVVAKYPHSRGAWPSGQRVSSAFESPARNQTELVIRVWEAQTQCSPSGLPTFLSTLVIAAGATFSILLGSRVMHFLR
ncbi:hypothetical protein KC320_g187 [Hortaea werneckii]|nr:hypothetical protein KC320_g187 [Hortaea werneckii]